MNIIKVQDIYPQLKKVYTVSELLLLDAINTVGMEFYNVHLDATGVHVMKDVKNTLAYKHMLEKLGVNDESGINASLKAKYGYGGMELSDLTIKEWLPIANAEFLDRALNLEFDKSKEQTNNEWVFIRTPLAAENHWVFKGFFAQGYLQVVAQVALYNYFHKTKIKLTVWDGCTSKSDNKAASLRDDMEYSHLIILRDRGNRLLVQDRDDENDNREINFYLDFMDKRGSSQEWAAYCAIYKMQGLFATKYDSKVKYNDFKSRFAVGDVILVYSRVAGVKKNNAASSRYVNTCYPAVVLEITPTHVSFVKYICIKTKLTAYKQFKHMLAQGGGDLISPDEVYNFPKASCTRRWEEVGVEGHTFNENEVIVTPMADDATYQYIIDNKTDVPLRLNTLETIYAVFEDRGVQYNKEKFLNTYFKGKVPIYDQEMERAKAQKIR